MDDVWTVQGDGAPLSVRVTEHIRELVRQGILSPGDKLPSEPDLAARLKVSRATVRSASAELMSEMVLERRRGIGTFVRDYSPLLSHGLERLMGTGDSIAELGMEAGAVDINIEHRQADSYDAEHFGLAVGERLVAISRTRTADGRPVLHCEERVPEALLPTSDALDSLGPGESLYRRLSELDLPLATALCDIVPRLAGRRIAERLEIAVDQPIVLLRQSHLSPAVSDRPVLYSENFYNNDMVGLRLIRRAHQNHAQGYKTPSVTPH